MLDNMLQQFQAFYTLPGLDYKMALISIALALVFGAIWLVIYRPWRFNKAWWVVIVIISAFLTWSAVAFIQIPLQTWTQEGLVKWLGPSSFMNWLYFTGLPIMLLSGLVQEGAKLVPVIFMWYTRGKQLEPMTGLYAGAVSGFGFGIFEAIWVHNEILASGWTWQFVSMGGPSALLGFVERFFSVGLHIAVSALAGYGWAKGLKWQYYLIAAGIHGLSNYAVILINKGALTMNQVELYIAGMAVAATVFAFLVLRRANAPEPEPEISDITSEPENPPEY